MPTRDEPTGDDESFVARWARRKQAARSGVSEVPAPDGLSSNTAGVPAAQAVVAPETALVEPEFDLASLPRIEDLTGESDFAQFMRKGVPEELRRLALRRAWSLDPAIRDFVEVAENQYDWNAVDGVPGFGPLAEGTDVEALLAQATGRLVPPAEGVRPGGSDPDCAARRPSDSPQQHMASTAPSTPWRDSATSQAAVDQPATANVLSAPGFELAHAVPAVADVTVITDGVRPAGSDPEHAAGSAPQRRRHGGALPA